MRTLLVPACLISIVALTVSAQTSGGGRSYRRRIAALDQTSNPIVVAGKVVLGDGSALTESAAIQTVCKGQKRTETHTDSRGNFSFQLGGRSATSSAVEFEADESASAPALRPERRDLQGCELEASLAGFTSDVIQLDGQMTALGSANGLRIALHGLKNVEGFTISATTAAAPGPARKALEKGREQAKKGQGDQAQKSFEKAVVIYPKFAVAWFELGKVQLERDDAVAARQSFQQSIAADSKYLNPYHGLAQIALRERKWPELLEVSDRLLALNPVSFPDVWLWNGVGHYYLHQLTAAENSARRGLEVDAEHRIPKLEYFLGAVLLEETDYQEAARHLRAFLTFATAPADVAEAKKQLDEVGRLSGARNLAAGEKK